MHVRLSDRNDSDRCGARLQMRKAHRHAGMMANLSVQNLIAYVTLLVAACAVNIWVASIGDLIIFVSAMMHEHVASENAMA